MGVTIATRLPVNILLPFNNKAIILTDYTSERQRSMLASKGAYLLHALMQAKRLLLKFCTTISLNTQVCDRRDHAFSRYELKFGDPWTDTMDPGCKPHGIGYNKHIVIDAESTACRLYANTQP